MNSFRQETYGFTVDVPTQSRHSDGVFTGGARTQQQLIRLISSTQAPARQHSQHRGPPCQSIASEMCGCPVTDTPAPPPPPPAPRSGGSVSQPIDNIDKYHMVRRGLAAWSGIRTASCLIRKLSNEDIFEYLVFGVGPIFFPLTQDTLLIFIRRRTWWTWQSLTRCQEMG